MITTQRTIEDYFERSGGKGTMHIERLLPPDILKDKVKMYAKVTIDVHSSLGYHMHQGDSESYYILQGEAKYCDDGEDIILQAGACTYTADGCGHSIENIGTTPLVFMAIILAY